MPSRSNPNTPTAQKRKSAAVLRKKRKKTQRLVTLSNRTDAKGAVRKVPKTSQALRKVSGEKRKKMRAAERKARREEKDAGRREARMDLDIEGQEESLEESLEKKEADMDID